MENVKLTPEQIKSVKSKGFLLNRGTNQFNGRIITENGILTGKQMAILAEAADKFGNGTIAFTVRLTVELPGIAFENVEPFREFVATGNMVTGGTGAKVRPVVACKGTTCVFGLYDTQGVATEVHKRFFEGYSDVILPHKFKIAVGGCPNNCVKPDLNDVGFVGQRIPQIKYEDCRGCKKCGMVVACPMNANRVVDGKIYIDKTICNNCGRCVGKCYFGIADESIDLLKVYIGGRWGKKIRIGSPLGQLFTKEEAFDVLEKTILLYKEQGIKGERLGETIDRIGLEEFESLLENYSINK